jgi:hypothetical protein
MKTLFEARAIVNYPLIRRRVCFHARGEKILGICMRARLFAYFFGNGKSKKSTARRPGGL